MHNIIEERPSFLSIAGLSVDSVYIARFKNSLKKNDYMSARRRTFKLNGIIGDTFYLPKYIKNFLIKYKILYENTNTGIFSILLALSFKPKNIFIFGVDFYDTHFFSHTLLSQLTLSQYNAMQPNLKNQKETFYKIVKNHKKTKFTIFTKSKLNAKIKKLSNIKIVKN